MYLENKYEFNSEYCRVTYIKEKNIVFLEWKKFCCGENYRKPALYALSLLEKFRGSNFAFDARNGFEDEMSMWEKEFNKYFNIKRVYSFNEVINYLDTVMK